MATKKKEPEEGLVIQDDEKTDLNIRSTGDMLYLAKDTAKFIRENRLSMQIQGKDYVLVEGWMFAGGRLGLLPVITSVNRIPTPDDEVKYEAWVELRSAMSSTIMGSGYAVCSNRESGKRYFQEYAIASMSQTRAIGKSYRNLLGWIIKAAGYESCPAEEMDFLIRDEDHKEPVRKPTQNKPRRDDDPVPVSATRNERPLGGYDKNGNMVEIDRSTGEVITLATPQQKKELLQLLSSECITEEERIAMIENMNNLNAERTQIAIEKIKKTITKREA